MTPRPGRLWTTACSVTLAGLLLGFASLATAKEKPPLPHITGAECGQCHQEIYRQWQESMHAKSTALKDPIHGAMYRHMVGDPTQEGVNGSNPYPVCLNCHAPGAARDGKTKLDALPAYEDGVSCVTCHTMTAFTGVKSPDGKFKVGVKAYEFSNDTLTGGNGAWNGKNPAVPPGADKKTPTFNPFPHAAKGELFKTSQVCMGCHEQLNNPHGVPICAIGDLLSKDGPKPTCQSCHMPVVNGVTSHTLGGAHDLGMLKRGVILGVSAKADAQGVSASVSLENTLMHTYPTGAPFRSVVVRVIALDAEGKEVWRNFKENAMAEDPQSVLMLKLTDDAGKPAMPMMSTKMGGDSRLQPGEKRTVAYTIPVQGVKTVRVELLYNLVSKLLIDMAGEHMPDSAKKPVLVHRAEAAL